MIRLCHPALRMLDVSNPGAEKLLGVDFAKMYNDSSLCAKNKADIDEQCKAPAGSEPLKFDSPFAVPFGTQVRQCCAVRSDLER